MALDQHDKLPHPSRSRFATENLKTYVGLLGLLGALAIAGTLWIFLAIADAITDGGALPRMDGAVARWLEAHGTETGETIFLVITQLGAPVLVASALIAVAALFWRGQRREAMALVIASGGGFLLDTGLKLLFHRGRPETATEFITHQSWSFPSGHAMESMVTYGFLAMLLLERTHGARARAGVRFAAGALIAIIGFSRLYLGVHYLSDVVGGWAAGAAWLIVCITAYRFAKGRSGHRVSGM